MYPFINHNQNDVISKMFWKNLHTLFYTLQFAECRDSYLAKKGYREAVVPQMNYIIFFDVRDDVVNVVGIFHQLENYQNKL